ncbi:hypothetical protein [Streptomyces sp. NPDC047024]|uniref:hypothetical protein n=1 Tax=Streptomyces sp. NPDC047024 TaxID=3155476 RepID=UPI0034016761
MLTDLVVSAWTAMRDLFTMSATWFAEPITEDLPSGSGAVHYVGGRICAWVAQGGEPHVGYLGKSLTLESLGDMDLTHFLRP